MVPGCVAVVPAGVIPSWSGIEYGAYLTPGALAVAVATCQEVAPEDDLMTTEDEAVQGAGSAREDGARRIRCHPFTWTLVRANLSAWPTDHLIEALVDERMQLRERSGGDPEHVDRAADALRNRLWGLPHDGLVDACIATIKRHGWCSSDGLEFHIDPQGVHRVSSGLTDEGKKMLKSLSDVLAPKRKPPDDR